MPNKTILRISDVTARTGLPRSSIYLKVSLDEFPKPINLGLRAVGWLSDEVDTWIDSRIKASRPSVAAIAVDWISDRE